MTFTLPQSARAALIGAFLIRLPFVFLPPHLSTDIHRYAWEGRVQWAGFNPFAVAPVSPLLLPLRDAGWPLINFPELAAIYPPLAQLLFLGAYFVFRSWTVPGLKVLFLGVELVNVLLLRRVLVRSGKPLRRALWYAWNPACAVEFCWSGHFDCLVVTALLGAWLGWLGWEGADRETASRWSGRRSLLVSVASLAAGTLLKFFPAAGLPFVLSSRGGWRPRLGSVVLFVAIVGIAYLPYSGAGRALFGSASEFRARWRHNESGFVAVQAAMGWAAGREADFDKPWTGGRDGYDLLALRRDQSLTAELARRLIEAGFLILLAGLLVRRTPFPSAMLLLMGYGIVFSPVVHPWYVLPLLPFAAVAGAPAWLWLSVAAQATYLPHAWVPDPVPGQVEWWIRVLEYAPFYGILAAGGLRRLRTRAALLL